MNVDMIDQAGTEVQGTFFQEQVDRFDDSIRIGGVYLISCGVVKPLKDQKFASAGTDMTIVFDKQTKIEQVHDDGDITEDGN